MSKKLLAILATLLIAVLVAGCGGGGEGEGQADNPEYVWKFAHEEIQGSVQDEYALKFKELVEENTEGRVQIDIYRVGELGELDQQVELLQNGGIEFAIMNPGATGTIIPESQLFYLHFLLPSDLGKVQQVLNNSQAIDQLNGLYEEKYIKVFNWFPEGYMMWTGNKELRTPADFKGFKMRTMPAPLIVEAYKAYGANPTPMPYTEVYSGLQLKMIDGQVNPIFAIEEMKFYEVQDYLMLSKQDIFVAAFTANANFWASVPEDLKPVIEDAALQASDYTYEMQEKLNNERLKKIKEASDIEIVELTDEERAAFRELSQPVRDKFVEMAGEKGEQILEQLEKDVNNL